MVILITGGAGFLGRRIVERFMQEPGFEVLTPRSTEMDLMDLQSVCRYIQRNKHVDAIVHSAAYYGGIGINVHQPADMLYINTVMAANVWEAAARMGIAHVQSVGSACAYPGDLTGEFKEEDLESGVCHPSVEGYGITKRIHRVFQRQYAKQHGIVGTQPVLTNLYGEHDDYTEYRSHVVAALIARFVNAVREGVESVSCWGDGSPVREFMYVGDAAEGIFKAFRSGAAGHVYNIGTGIGTSIKELTDLVVELTGYEGKVDWDTTKPNGASHKVLDVSKAKNELNFTAKVSLRAGLKKTIDWYRSVY